MLTKIETRSCRQRREQILEDRPYFAKQIVLETLLLRGGALWPDGWYLTPGSMAP